MRCNRKLQRLLRVSRYKMELRQSLHGLPRMTGSCTDLRYSGLSVLPLRKRAGRYSFPTHFPTVPILHTLFSRVERQSEISRPRSQVKLLSNPGVS